NGIVVVSGLAYGIDTTSHMAVVKAGGTTYAVIACGQDRISPQSSQKNADKIIEAGGAIVSEYRFGVPARPGYFPQRNRIISGMSDACLVVESGSRGGSLITAKFAFDQERDVFAIPGNISSQKSEGTNTLIKTNIAMPALTPGGVLEDLGIDFEKLDFSEMKIKFDSSEEEMLYNKLSFEPVHIDTLADNTKLDISVILVRLLDLEFKGLARQLPGKYYIKAS
ncbi:MAG: DNA-processing protein DprA, partial [Bacteroidota bacterium]